MSDPAQNESGDRAADAIRRKAERREHAAKRGTGRGVLFGFGMFGLVGWAVAVPTLAGIALGIWLDRIIPGPFSWTLALLLGGVALGCLNAWWWVSKESPGD